jgi:threonine/homoserine/homoserine lactone efflux protein
MISSGTLVLFLGTVIPLVCTPGPDILFVSSQSLVSGRRGAVLATAGICAGYLLHAVLATVGLAAAIAASPHIFLAIRLVGALYLLYLGVKLCRAALRSMHAGDGTTEALSNCDLMRRGMLTSLLNPKGLLFFLALLPQFVDTNYGPAAIQVLILALLFVLACFCVYLTVGLAVAAGREKMAGGRRFTALANGLAGLILVGLGIRFAVKG